MVLWCLFAYYLGSAGKGTVDMVANVLPTNHFHKAGFVQSMEYMVVHTGENQLNTTRLRALVELFEVVDTCGIDKGHFAHANNTHFLSVFAYSATNVLKFVGYTEEIRTVNLIDLGVFRNLEHFQIIAVETDIVVLGGVKFVGESANDRRLVGTLDKQKDCQ